MKLRILDPHAFVRAAGKTEARSYLNPLRYFGRRNIYDTPTYASRGLTHRRPSLIPREDIYYQDPQAYRDYRYDLAQLRKEFQGDVPEYLRVDRPTGHTAYGSMLYKARQFEKGLNKELEFQSLVRHKYGDRGRPTGNAPDGDDQHGNAGFRTRPGARRQSGRSRLRASGAHR